MHRTNLMTIPCSSTEKKDIACIETSQVQWQEVGDFVDSDPNKQAGLPGLACLCMTW
jgi:type II secretory pathway component PulL